MILAGVTGRATPYDMSCFGPGAKKLLADGPAGFDSGGYFADYPPGYLFVLGLGAGTPNFSHTLRGRDDLRAAGRGAQPVRLRRRRAGVAYWPGKSCPSRLPLLLAAFEPLTRCCCLTQRWEQIDGAFALRCCYFYLLEKRRYLPAAVLHSAWRWPLSPRRCCLGRCWPCVFGGHRAGRKPLPRIFALLRRCGAGAFPPLALGLPYFGLTNLLPKLLENMPVQRQLPYATINGFNWLAALGATGHRWTTPCCWASPGNSWAFSTFCWSRWGWWSGGAQRAGGPLLAAAAGGLLRVGHFTLAHCMHERYMVPGVLLTLLAAAH